MRRALPSLLVLAALAPAHGVAAQADDGLYGRFDSALSVVLAAGAAVTTDGDAGLFADARLRIVDAGGPVLTLHTEAGGPARMFAGVELRPLFPSLFLQNLYVGRPYLDLFLQSFAVELGLDAPLVRPMPLGVTWGLAIEVPLLTPARFAHGLGVRIGFRRTRFVSDARPQPAVPGDERLDAIHVALSLGLDAGNAVANWEPPRHRHR